MTADSNDPTKYVLDLKDLSPETTYEYQIMVGDIASEIGAFTTVIDRDTTPPIISNVGVSDVTSSVAAIRWATNELSDTQIEYGLTASYGSMTTLSTSMVNTHIQQLTNLQAGTLYHFRVKSKDAAGNLTVSGDFTFKTTGTLTINPVSVLSVTSTTARLETTAQNLPAGATVKISYWPTDEKRSRSEMTLTMTQSTTDPAKFYLSLKDLMPETEYEFEISFSLNSSTLYSDWGSFFTVS